MVPGRICVRTQCFSVQEFEKWTRTCFPNLKFSKCHDPSIKNELILSQTASRRAESKDAERQLIFSGLDVEIRPKRTSKTAPLSCELFIHLGGAVGMK